MRIAALSPRGRLFGSKGGFSCRYHPAGGKPIPLGRDRLAAIRQVLDLLGSSDDTGRGFTDEPLRDDEWPRAMLRTQAVTEEQFALKNEAVQLLCLVVAEWQSDPMSVQCFDLRTVERAKAVTKRLAELDKLVAF